MPKRSSSCKTELRGLARSIVRIYSPSGEEERLCRFLNKYLSRYFEVKIQKVDRAFNILAFVGTPQILLTTHIDTVPGKLKVWSDDSYLYGRGACDAKGIAACMIIAARRAKESGYCNFGLLLDVGEETDFRGAKTAIASITPPKLVVVGEPTDMKIITGQKGVLLFQITASGKAAHSSTDNPKSAVLILLDFLEELRSMSLPVTEIGKTTINIGKIRGGVISNVVPASASAEIEFRTTAPNKTTISMVVELTKKYKMKADILLDYDPVVSRWTKSSVKAIASYFTELFFYNQVSEAIVLGPGDWNLAHSDNEKIRLSDLDVAVDKYLDILSKNQNQTKGIEPFDDKIGFLQTIQKKLRRQNKIQPREGI
jgi:acetylornithine deacetylase